MIRHIQFINLGIDKTQISERGLERDGLIIEVNKDSITLILKFIESLRKENNYFEIIETRREYKKYTTIYYETKDPDFVKNFIKQLNGNN